MNKIAVIAAHPDDEALGCGGTLLKYKNLGAEISLLLMTDGVGARAENDAANQVRAAGIQQAIQFLAPNYHQLLNFPDNQMDVVPMLDIAKAVEAFLAKTQPDIILTHFKNDLNIDHALTFQAVMTATRPGSRYAVKQIYSFEVQSSTEWSIGSEVFRPDCFIDITSTIDRKMDYLRCYETELRPHPHTRSLENIRALHQLRGGQVSVPYAEAFMTIRRILDVF